MSDTSSSTPHDDQPFDLETEPLDRPQLMAHDWGGDGTDLSRPVRAHVLAALRPNTAPYPPPVDALRHLGDPREAGTTERRNALGLTQEHLPDLLRMARDRALSTANDDTYQVWAPLHALYALRDLDVSAVVPELIPLFDLEDDWLFTDLPELLGKVGAPALEPIRDYLADHTRWAFGQSTACRALKQIAEQYPDLREQVVAMLGDVLRHAEDYHEIANTGAMDALVELGVIEALPLIRRAFELGQIDEMMRGPWGDVLNELGVEPEEGDPLLAESRRRFEERQDRLVPRETRELLRKAIARLGSRDEEPSTQLDPRRLGQPNQDVLERLMSRDALESRSAEPTSVPPAPRDPGRTAEAKARKQKNKRKMESASRKANRRKRR